MGMLTTLECTAQVHAKCVYDMTHVLDELHEVYLVLTNLPRRFMVCFRDAIRSVVCFDNGTTLRSSKGAANTAVRL